MHIVAPKQSWTSRQDLLGTVIFELKTLLEVTDTRRDDEAPAGTFLHKGEVMHVYKRDHGDALLEWMVRYGVKRGVWSCETRRYTLKALRSVYDVKTFACIKTRRSCDVHRDMYVKNMNGLKKTVLLFDFNIVQVDYNVEHGVKSALYIDTTADLRRFHTFLKKGHRLYGSLRRRVRRTVQV